MKTATEYFNKGLLDTSKALFWFCFDRWTSRSDRMSSESFLSMIELELCGDSSDAIVSLQSFWGRGGGIDPSKNALLARCGELILGNQVQGKTAACVRDLLAEKLSSSSEDLRLFWKQWKSKKAPLPSSQDLQSSRNQETDCALRKMIALPLPVYAVTIRIRLFLANDRFSSATTVVSILEKYDPFLEAMVLHEILQDYICCKDLPFFIPRDDVASLHGTLPAMGDRLLISFAAAHEFVLPKFQNEHGKVVVKSLLKLLVDSGCTPKFMATTLDLWRQHSSFVCSFLEKGMTREAAEKIISESEIQVAARPRGILKRRATPMRVRPATAKKTSESRARSRSRSRRPRDDY
jgi:hypothetical protein